MNNERDQQHDRPITLEAVTARAKETLLADGKHMPMLIVEGEQQSLIVGFAEMPRTHLDRMHKMFLAGIAAAQDSGTGQLAQVFFISEAWMSIAENKMPDVPPSEDPHRMEVLVVANLRLEDKQTKMAVVEMVRDSEGILRELRDYQPPGISEEYVENSLVLAFIAGYELGQSGIDDVIDELLH